MNVTMCQFQMKLFESQCYIKSLLIHTFLGTSSWVLMGEKRSQIFCCGLFYDCVIDLQIIASNGTLVNELRRYGRKQLRPKSPGYKCL
jgi:hypothetical protein